MNTPVEADGLVTAAGSPPAYLALRRLTKRYGAVTAVDDLSLEVGAGEFIALLGPSGCGKTTTLRMVAGLVPPTAGETFLDGRPITPVPPYRRNIGIVFQNYALFPHLNVDQNVAFGLEMRAVARSDIGRRVTEALALVRLDGLGRRRIRELSGGQQQRVALARALVIRPAVLLLDEPLSNLDAKLREEMRNEIREIQQQLGITTVLVTHDQVEALTMADRVAVLNRGRLEQYGSPREVFERPANRFLAAFIGRANFIPAEVVGSRADGALARIADGVVLPIPRALPEGARVTLMLRPHRLRLALPTSGDGLPGRVRRATYLGDLLQYEVSAGPLTLVVEQPNNDETASDVREGDEVLVHWRPDDALVFD